MYKLNIEWNVNPPHDHNPTSYNRQHPSSAEDKVYPSCRLDSAPNPQVPFMLLHHQDLFRPPATWQHARLLPMCTVPSSITSQQVATYQHQSKKASTVGYYIHPARRWPTKGEANNQNHLGNKLAAITVSQFTTLMLPNKKCIRLQYMSASIYCKWNENMAASPIKECHPCR
jgi:hypothetical protein